MSADIIKFPGEDDEPPAPPPLTAEQIAGLYDLLPLEQKRILSALLRRLAASQTPPETGA